MNMKVFATWALWNQTFPKNWLTWIEMSISHIFMSYSFFTSGKSSWNAKTAAPAWTPISLWLATRMGLSRCRTTGSGTWVMTFKRFDEYVHVILKKDKHHLIALTRDTRSQTYSKRCTTTARTPSEAGISSWWALGLGLCISSGEYHYYCR